MESFESLKTIKLSNVRNIVQIEDKDHHWKRRAKKMDELILGKKYHFVIRTFKNSNAMVTIGSDHVSLRPNSMITITSEKKGQWKKVKSGTKSVVGWIWYNVVQVFGGDKPEEYGPNAVIGVRG